MRNGRAVVRETDLSQLDRPILTRPSDPHIEVALVPGAGGAVVVTGIGGAEGASTMSEIVTDMGLGLGRAPRKGASVTGMNEIENPGSLITTAALGIPEMTVKFANAKPAQSLTGLPTNRRRLRGMFLRHRLRRLRPRSGPYPIGLRLYLILAL